MSAVSAGLEAARADREALATIAREHGVETLPEAPGWASYFQDLTVTVGQALAGWLEGFAPGVAGVIGGLATLGAPLIFGLTLALILILVGRTVGERFRRRGGAPLEDRAIRVELAGGEPDRSRVDWEAELARRLVARDAPAAAEALWWWLASALTTAAVPASWTTRELLAQAGREDLRPAGRRLDRLLYGAAAPTAGEVRRLWDDLRPRVAPAAAGEAEGVA